MSNFQTCPPCNGLGFNTKFYNATTNPQGICTCCNGKKVISTQTAQPPKEEDKNESSGGKTRLNS